MIGLPSNPPTETTMQSASEKLLPCPFCGSHAEIVEAEEAGPAAYVVVCQNRRCETSSAVVFAVKDGVEDRLTDLWNRRATQAPAPAGIDDAAVERAKAAWNSTGHMLDDFDEKCLRAALSAASIVPSTSPQAGGMVPGYWKEIVMGLHKALGVEWGDDPYARIEQLRAASPEPPAASPVEGDEWHDMKTAPKDGTKVLLINRAGNMAVGLWQGRTGVNEGWWLRGGNRPDSFFNSHYGPTHWRLLPAPPATPPSTEAGR